MMNFALTMMKFVLKWWAQPLSTRMQQLRLPSRGRHSWGPAAPCFYHNSWRVKRKSRKSVERHMFSRIFPLEFWWDYQYSATTASIMCGTLSCACEIHQFVYTNSLFLIQRPLFLIQNSSFLIQNLSFLTHQRPECSDKPHNQPQRLRAKNITKHHYKVRTKSKMKTSHLQQQREQPNRKYLRVEPNDYSRRLRSWLFNRKSWLFNKKSWFLRPYLQHRLCKWYPFPQKHHEQAREPWYHKVISQEIGQPFLIKIGPVDPLITSNLSKPIPCDGVGIALWTLVICVYKCSYQLRYRSWCRCRCRRALEPSQTPLVPTNGEYVCII